ncbi:MAG TPA: RNA 2',3'-cyclic phosphodiesterase [Candidatus Dormibacteraeota bacterium]|nr:RNA 2',3'-cyclic phosphodiesterase [Candidatus Dormibacteraeota bacterium]
MASHGTQLLGTCPLEETHPLKLRAFFGLPVPATRLEPLSQYVEACASVAPEFRWVPPANLHLTVRFVGSVERELVDRVAGRLETAGLSSFELELGDLGTFRRGRLVRVVWVGLRSGAEQASELAARVEAECDRAGLASEARAFQPHLTLARARARDGGVLPVLPEAPRVEPWRARELVLYQSRLGRAGAAYEPLRVLRLD